MSIALNVAETDTAAQRLYAKCGCQIGWRAMRLDLNVMPECQQANLVLRR
jgi:hypothetical protein